jgi:hypothetical protein
LTWLLVFPVGVPEVRVEEMAVKVEVEVVGLVGMVEWMVKVLVGVQGRMVEERLLSY